MIEQKPQGSNYPGKTQTSRPETISIHKPPQTFNDHASKILLKKGVPPYLIKYYVNWCWQYENRQKSVDQIWAEFVQVAFPLMTNAIKKNDPVTCGFVKKLLQPRIDEDHSLDELESKGRHWPLLPGSFETGKRR